MLVVLAACAAKPSKPVETKAVLAATADVNPDSSGRPSPVVVRIYQLRGDAEFNGADFFALYDKEKDTLGASLILRDEQTLFPGQQIEMKLPLSADARFVGAIAGFRDVQGTRWRAVVGAPEKSLLKLLSKNRITVRVDKAAITLSTKD
jgi:type VI secretion system protein VasD